MSVSKALVLGCVLGLADVLATHSAQAQVALVNCGIFQNPLDRARCAQANQAAVQAYLRERAATFGYYGANGANMAAPYFAGRVVPYFGKPAYQGGGWFGNRMYQNWPTGRVPQFLQPGFNMQYPYPGILFRR